MIDFIIEKSKAVSITGHREIGLDCDKNKLKQTFLSLIEKENFNTFLIGMAVGFDMLCFSILEEIRKEKDIKLVACVPCREQDKLYSFSQKTEYRRMLNSADQTIILKENYDKYCMIKRNEFMVDNSSILVAYLRKDKGGTAFTVRNANKKNVPVIKI